MSRINSNPAKLAILFLSCVVFHLAGTWSLPLIDRDEPRFAEASREMMERGDYVVPCFNNQFRFDKPPFTYWMQVASYRILGDNDFAARFPSVIAAALVALTIFKWGSRIADERLGLWAAVIFTVSLQAFIHAKAAVADMWLVLFMTTAHWAGFELLFGGTRAVVSPTSNLERNGARPFTCWWIFYLSLAFAFLAKGPIGWLPLLTIAAMKILDRQYTLAKDFKFVRGIIIMLAVVCCWGIPALIRTNGEFFRVGIMHHVVDRSFNAMEGHGSNSLGLYLLLLPLYFVTIFLSFFPWSINLPRLVRKLWTGRDGIDNYLIAGILVVFITFTLVSTKLPHYTLPAFPLLALLVARLFFEEKAGQSFRRVAIAWGAFLFLLALIVPPLAAPSMPAFALFQKARENLKPDMEFGATDFTEPSLVWYFRSRAKGFLTPLKKREVSNFMAKPGPRFVIQSGPPPDHPADWKEFSARGFNIPKGKNVDLTMLLKPE